MTELAVKPDVRPANSNFSSGPCSKRPGWSLEGLADAPLGRSHRAKPGKAKLAEAIDLTRKVLQDGDIFVTFGAGSIGAWAADFVSRHRARGKSK